MIQTLVKSAIVYLKVKHNIGDEDKDNYKVSKNNLKCEIYQLLWHKVIKLINSTARRIPPIWAHDGRDG